MKNPSSQKYIENGLFDKPPKLKLPKDYYRLLNGNSVAEVVELTNVSIIQCTLNRYI